MPWPGDHEYSCTVTRSGRTRWIEFEQRLIAQLRDPPRRRPSGGIPRTDLTVPLIRDFLPRQSWRFVRLRYGVHDARKALPVRCAYDRVVAVTEGNERQTVPERWNAVGAGSDMWMDMALDPRFTTGAEPEGERATLLDYLRAYRLTMEMKCSGLDAAQLARRSVPPSTMSLLGLIRHMADVERNWFRRVMAQADAPPLYWSEDAPDADWLGAVADPAVVDDAWRAWRDEVDFAEKFVADFPDLGVKGTNRDGSSVALRSVLVHMIEEYARHCGHADLLRERIDGRVGQ
jgi:uncharacterized damage-inducible protein DinB